jgi:hypothetical protein
MFKKVLLAGALLAPVLAYGASPSTDLSVQIVPAASPTPTPSPSPPSPSGGIACAIGPNYTGSVPTAAQAAGFTTCAANYDFTSPAYSNIATWLDCKGASTPQWAFAYGNCAHINMITDGGTQVLDLQWQPSDYGTFTSTGIQTGDPNNSSDLSQAILTLPTGKYIEVVSRTPAATENNACNSGCFYGATWSWGGNGNPNFIEWDFIEYYYNGVNSDGAQLHPTDGASGYIDAIGEYHNVSGYDPTQYNTFGIRTVTDTNGDLIMCTYLNGSLINGGGTYPCGSGTYSPIPVGRNFLVMDMGPQGSNPNYLTTGDYYVQRVTVWECAGWATGECYNSSSQVTNGGALTHAP